MTAVATDRRVAVAVIGGGPAGCAAAIELRRLGVEVALLERSAHKESRIGENLSGAARPLLAHLGALEDFLEAGHLSCPGIASAWGADTQRYRDSLFTANGPGW